VHPNDEQAAALEGPGQFGKTEAWHILSAEPEARLIAGVRPGATREVIARAIRAGSILDWAQYHPVRAGDTVFMPAGTLHALGPGLLLYEVQQTSDITYRVFDWNRPASAGRALHLEQSAVVTDATATGQPSARPTLRADDQCALVQCNYFTLDLIAAREEAVSLDIGGHSFQALTVIEGEAAVARGDEAVTLRRFETVIVPAAGGPGQLRPNGACRVLRARVPG
jgi:mannose-6-phosphate isomerase